MQKEDNTGVNQYKLRTGISKIACSVILGQSARLITTDSFQ